MRSFSPTLKLYASFVLGWLTTGVTSAAETISPAIASLLDRSLEPIPINQNPGPEYAATVLNYAMARGIELTPRGRLWAAWIAGGDSAPRTG